ncbi:unnamed protein product [Nesidiocoris tenuis]|uniref:Tektin n=1 Tax=Nesidiocoris tenuis TaxID=355587 RepID=A0A6H5GK51_9HEMI|nr:unnamed protein product [Nesidiocoris tenuis]
MKSPWIRRSLGIRVLQECALVREVSNLIDKTLVQIEEQLERNNAIKDRLESDWSDKFEAHQLESDGVKLRTSSTTTLFKPSATKFPADCSGRALPSRGEGRNLVQYPSLKLLYSLNKKINKMKNPLRFQPGARSKEPRGNDKHPEGPVDGGRGLAFEPHQVEDDFGKRASKQIENDRNRSETMPSCSVTLSVGHGDVRPLIAEELGS